MPLRSNDQAVIAVAAACFWLLLLVHWLASGGARGELVNIDELETRPIQFLIDINAAGWPEFAVLPGIGETRARGIVQLREHRGRFQDPEELLDVRGIGPKTMAKIRPFLAVRQSNQQSTQTRDGN